MECGSASVKREREGGREVVREGRREGEKDRVYASKKHTLLCYLLLLLIVLFFCSDPILFYLYFVWYRIIVCVIYNLG